MAKKTGKKKKAVKPPKKTRSETRKQLDKRRKHLEKLEKRLTNVDKELAQIEKDLVSAGLSQSVLLDTELEKRRRVLSMEIEDDLERDERNFYRNFVMRCKSCKKQFEREIKVSSIKKRLYCPACGKDHTLGIRPSTRVHTITFPKTLKLLKRKK